MAEAHMRATVIDGDVREPLEIPRENLLQTLNENLEKERAERAEKRAKENAQLDEFKAFLNEHQDEVAAYVATALGWSGSWGESLKAIERLFEDRDYKPVAVKPSEKENALEKFVRVLNLASNKTINVQPGDDLYPLL